MKTRSVCAFVLLALFVTVVHSSERSLLGTSQGPKTTDPVKKQEAGTGKTTTPPTPKKQEVAKGRTAATGTPNSKQASTAPGQGARSGDIGVARTVTPVRSTPTELGHRRALLDTPPAQKTTAATAPPKKAEAGAAKTTTPPKTTASSSSKQQEAAKGRAPVGDADNKKPAATAPGQGARSGADTGDVGVGRGVTPVKAVPISIGHRRAVLGTSQGPKAPAAPAKNGTVDAAKKTEKGTTKQPESAKGRTAATGAANSKPASTAPGQGARSGANTGDVGISRTVTPVRAVPIEIGHRRVLLGTSPAPKTAGATTPPQDSKSAAPKKTEAGAAKTTTPPKTTTPAKPEAAKGRTAPAGTNNKNSTAPESGARAGIGRFDYVLPGDPLVGKK